MKVSGELQAPAALSPEKRVPLNHWILVGGWVGPRSSLDVLEERKVSFPRRDPNSGSPPHNLVPILKEVFWIIYFLSIALGN
jgi:hypothetical protein